MRYLKRFNENLVIDDRIECNIKDIFVEYQDSHELNIYVHKGNLPTTVVGLDDNIIELTLFEQRGIRFNNISGEIDMLIEYVKSLSDKEIKIYVRFDKRDLYLWSGGFSGSHNTLELFFVECVTPSATHSQKIYGLVW